MTNTIRIALLTPTNPQEARPQPSNKGKSIVGNSLGGDLKDVECFDVEVRNIVVQLLLASTRLIARTIKMVRLRRRHVS